MLAVFHVILILCITAVILVVGVFIKYKATIDSKEEALDYCRELLKRNGIEDDTNHTKNESVNIKNKDNKDLW